MKTKLIASLALLAIGHAAQAATVDIDLTVDAKANLYHDNWHNVYTTPAGGCGNDAEFNCPIGIGQAPELVSFNGNPFNFSGLNSVSLFASGTVKDAGETQTGPTGDAVGDDFGFVRQLPAYSLIGIWSSTFDKITPIGINFDNPAQDTARFVVGNSLIDLAVPNANSVYMFLAENDGIFSDNEGAYNVTVRVENVAVPLPGAALLFGSALFGLLNLRRKKS